LPNFVNSYAELSSRQFDVVINATSSGLSGEMPPLPRREQIPPSPPFAKGGLRGIFAPGALAYEMMYGRETPFMKFAREQGASIVSDGLGMLVEQAAESFFIWRGVRPDTAPALSRLRNP
jgi:shikimate dehydrogenase